MQVMKSSSQTAAARLASEREFHNNRFKEGDSRQAQLKYYWAVQRGAELFVADVDRLARGADVLEYGCGPWASAGRLGPVAKQVHAIDISEEAIRVARQNCPLDNVTFSVRDAMDMKFPSASFDLVFGSGVVHHLDTAACAREVARVLRPGGHALFWEPLGLNPLINAYRWLTPSARTVDEHPLLPRDIQILREHFASVELEFFGLASLAAVPFRNSGAGATVRRVLERLDDAIVSLPGVRFLAWYSIIRCAK
jgi:SAM-dependent methyltransferase